MQYRLARVVEHGVSEWEATHLVVVTRGRGEPERHDGPLAHWTGCEGALIARTRSRARCTQEQRAHSAYCIHTRPAAYPQLRWWHLLGCILLHSTYTIVYRQS